MATRSNSERNLQYTQELTDNGKPSAEPRAPTYERTLQFIFENNGSLNLTNQGSGETLAHLASATSDLLLLKILSRCGHLKAIINVEDREGNTPLSIALAITKRNDKLIKFLLKNSAANVGRFPLLSHLKNAPKDSLEWTIAAKCGLRWTVAQIEEFYSQMDNVEQKLLLLKCSGSWIGHGVERRLHTSSCAHSKLIALLTLRSYFATQDGEFKTIFDIVELSQELRSRIFTQVLIEIVTSSNSELLKLQSLVVSHFTTVEVPGVCGYYNSDNSSERTAKLKSFVLLCGTTHFQSLMTSCRATMRAAIDWFESPANSHLLPLLLGPITDIPKLDTSYESEGGTATVYGVEGTRDLVCKRTMQYKSFVREAIAMKIHPKSAYLMSYVSLHWDEQRTLFGITMQRMETDLQKELARAQIGAQPLTHVHEIVVSIVKGMIDMHRTGFTHLDIKPGNVLLSWKPDLSIKIADFGTVHLDSNSRDQLYTIVASYTPAYAPPEVLNGKVTRQHIQQADAYSFGCLLQKLLRYCTNQTMARIMEWCLNKDYSKRPTFNEILSLLDAKAGKIAEIQNFQQNNLNILVFGEKGSGKTSFVLSLIRAFVGKPIFQDPQLGKEFEGTPHSSTTLQQVRLSNNVSLWDPWGAAVTNYQNSELKYMVTGRVPVGWDMKQPLTFDNIIKDNATCKRNEPHAVLFVISQAQVEDTECMGRVRDWIDTLCKERPELTPIILLSKIDEIDPRLCQNIEALENNQLLSDKIAKLSANTGVPRIFIYPLLLHVEEADNTDLIDVLVLNIASNVVYLASRIARNE